MNTHAPLPPDVPGAPDTSSSHRSNAVRRALWLFLILGGIALAAWQWWRMQPAAMPLPTGVSAESASGTASPALLARLEALEARLAGLEHAPRAGDPVAAPSAESAALALLEVEQALALASQQLQLLGDVPLALRSVQLADARLARLNAPNALALRKSLARDIERLKAIPFVDVAGISIRLEQVISAADQWPLAQTQHPADSAAAEPVAVAEGWRGILALVWTEIRGLIRIQRMDRVEPPLLAPGQEFFLRENVKLRLLNARLALLAREQAVFRHEIKLAQGWLAQHFIRDDPAVIAAQGILRDIAQAPIQLELPSLQDSLNAVRALRQSREAL